MVDVKATKGVVGAEGAVGWEDIADSVGEEEADAAEAEVPGTEDAVAAVPEVVDIAVQVEEEAIVMFDPAGKRDTVTVEWGVAEEEVAQGAVGPGDEGHMFADQEVVEEVDEKVPVDVTDAMGAVDTGGLGTGGVVVDVAHEEDQEFTEDEGCAVGTTMVGVAEEVGVMEEVVDAGEVEDDVVDPVVVGIPPTRIFSNWKCSAIQWTDEQAEPLHFQFALTMK